MTTNLKVVTAGRPEPRSEERPRTAHPGARPIRLAPKDATLTEG